MTEKIKAYLKDKKALIVDPSSSSISSAQLVLKELGIPSGQIHQARSYQTAMELLHSIRPQIVICEYNIEEHFGIDLIAHHNRLYAYSENRIFILLTGNASDTSVAEAAEEDIDSYLLKPFSMSELKKKILKTVSGKLNPSLYQRQISMGKRALFKGDNEKALSYFLNAQSKDRKPSLAHYYAGKAYLEIEGYAEALDQFQKALKINPIHYKALNAQFELFDKIGKVGEAYKVIQVISKHFPISPQRLGRMFWLAIQTRNYSDVARYYEIYLNLDHRTPELVKIVSAGLMACGRFMIRDSHYKDAVTIFRNGVTNSERSPSYIYKIVDILLQAELTEDALNFLSLVPPDERQTDEYQRLEFKIHTLCPPKAEVIEMFPSEFAEKELKKTA